MHGNQIHLTFYSFDQPNCSSHTRYIFHHERNSQNKWTLRTLRFAHYRPPTYHPQLYLIRKRTNQNPLKYLVIMYVSLHLAETNLAIYPILLHYKRNNNKNAHRAHNGDLKWYNVSDFCNVMIKIGLATGN